MKRIEDAARKVADGDFATRIPVDSSGQLGQLARTFNEMQRRLAELDSARKQFIANASHELRTPIFSLGGFVELLDEEDPSPEERAEFVRTMREQIERLTKLTTDLLDLSQLDAGGIVMAIDSVDLSALARDVAREFGARADLHGSRLELRTPDRPVIAVADPERVRQIIRILLDNALTHTPEGTKVTVTIYSVNHRAELTVSDDGTGIPQRVQKRIFERFYTADSGGGSGLGLAIARELAQRMDGRISITSSRRFTAFTLDLPLAPPGSAGGGRRRPGEGARVRAPTAPCVGRRCSRCWRCCCSRAAAAAAAAARATGAPAGDQDDDRRSSCRRPATASTRPRSTARPRPAWSRSARSSTRAPPKAPASSSTPTAGSSPTPTSSPTARASDRKEAKAVYVEFPDRNVVPAKIVGFDPFADVALLEVDPDGFDLHPLELGDDDDLVVGQPVAAIGSPFGEQQSLSVGIVSATDRSVDSLTQFQIEGAIQTDASINPGNSGGPLLDAGARVIGINQQIETNSGANDGVGFAVPISAVKRSLAQLERKGRVEYAYIGVSTQALYPQLAEKLDLDADYGGLLAEVVPDGPADEAGWRAATRRSASRGFPTRPAATRSSPSTATRCSARRPRPLHLRLPAGRQGDARRPPDDGEREKRRGHPGQAPGRRTGRLSAAASSSRRCL